MSKIMEIDKGDTKWSKILEDDGECKVFCGDENVAPLLRTRTRTDPIE